VKNQSADIAMLKVVNLQSGDDPEDILRESLADLYATDSPKISKGLSPSSVSIAHDARAKVGIVSIWNYLLIRTTECQGFY
jgi:hypothetical protein